MEDLIRDAYYDYLIENNLEDAQKSIDLFITSIYYDIQDNMDLLNGLDIPNDLDELGTQLYIEHEIERIVKGE